MEQTKSDEGGRTPKRLQRSARGLRTAASRLPMKWITIIATGLLLVATAAFGGLEPAPAKPVPQLAVGEEFNRGDISMTVVRAGLAEPAFTNEENPTRQLFIEFDLLNHEDAYQPAFNDGGLRPVRIADVEDLGYASFTRPGEGGLPVMQPGVPATVRVQWEVPRDAFTPGQTVRIVLPEAKPRRMFTSSSIVWDVTDGAYVDAVLEDVGEQ